MSQVSLGSSTDPLVGSLPLDDTQASSAEGGALSGSVNKSTGGSPPSPRSRRATDDLPDFSYDPDGHSRDPLDSWPERVEVRPRRRSAFLSSLVRGNQPRRSFFSDSTSHDDSEPAASEKNQDINPLGNVRVQSKTAVSTLKEKVLLPAAPLKQKRSTSQSENSRACMSCFFLVWASCPCPECGDVRRSGGPSEEIHSPACKGVPHVRRAVPSRRGAAVRGSRKASHPCLVRFHPRHHNGLLQRRRDPHDRTALCALQRAHRTLGTEQRPRRIPRRL